VKGVPPHGHWEPGQLGTRTAERGGRSKDCSLTVSRGSAGGAKKKRKAESSASTQDRWGERMWETRKKKPSANLGGGLERVKAAERENGVMKGPRKKTFLTKSSMTHLAQKQSHI